MNEDENKELARIIGAAARSARKTRELTQEATAEKIGVSAEFYARIERGGALPSVPTLVGIANTLGVSADEMLGGIRPRAQPGAGKPKQLLGPPPVENSDLRKLLRKLRKGPPETRRLVSLLVKALES